MPYKFGEYVSTYVDPQSVKISETLRNRFLENFRTNDQLTMAVEAMQAASAFENDVIKKQELQRKTENALAQLAEQGDYENMGFQLHKTAKDFAKQYAPIEENYKRYQGALSNIAKAYEEGKVNAEYANLYKSYMARNYKGFEVDPETGRAVQESMFTAPGIINDPKVFERLKKAVKLIHERKTNSKVSNVAQGPDGMYKVSTETGVEEVPPELVQEAIDMVMNESDVKAYIGQMSDMQAYNIQRQGAIPEALQSQAANIQSSINMIDETLAKGGLSTAYKNQLLNTKVNLNKELESINAGLQDPDGMGYKYIQNRLANDMFRPTTDFVLHAASYKNIIASITDIDYDAKWIQDRKAALDAEAALGSTIYKYGEVSLADAYGTNLAQKQDAQRAAYDRMVQYEKIAKDESYNDEERKSAALKAKSAKAEMDAIRQQIQIAGNSVSLSDFTKIDPILVQSLKEAFPWAKTPGELFLKLQDALRQPNNNNPEFVKLKTAYDNTHSDNLETYIGEAYKVVVPGGGIDQRSERAARAFIGDTSTPEGHRIGTFNDVLTKFSGSTEIDYKFKEIKESNLFSYGKIDMGDPKLTKAVTDAADKFFLDRPIAEDETVIDITSNGVTELNGKDLVGYKIIARGWNETTNIWELELENGDGDVKTVHYNGNRITNKPLENLMNQPDVKLARIAKAMNSHIPGSKGATTRELKVIKGTKEGGIEGYNTTMILHSTIGSDGTQYFTITHENGEPYVDPGYGLDGTKYSITNSSFLNFMTGFTKDPKTGEIMPIVELIN